MKEIKRMTEISFAYGEVPLPPGIRPIVLLSGSDYDLGYQYYQQLVQIFGGWILRRLVQNKLGNEEQKRLKACERQIRENALEMIDMFKGMADGATAAGIALTYEEVLSHCCREREPGVEEIPRSGGCSGFAAWGRATKDGRLICAGSTDHELKFEVTVAVFPRTGNSFIISPFRATEFGVLGGHPGMNSRGLAYVHHGATHWIQCKPKEKRTEGIPEGIAVLHTIRFASDAVEAQEMQLAHPSGSGFVGGFWADIEGNAFIIECREQPRALRKAGDYGETDFLYSTNNALCKELGHCQDPPEEGNTYISHGGWLGRGNTISSVSRNLFLWDMLHHYQGHVDINFVKMMWRSAGEPPSYSTLEEAEALYYETKGEGWHTKPANQWNAMVGIMVPDNGYKGLYHVCSGCPARGGQPFNPRGHSYQAGATQSFYELTLARGPKEITEAAKERAQYSLYYANRELKNLNYSDVAYAPLDEIFNQAANEWHTGQYYREMALSEEAEGHDTVYKWGKALRAFTRCQCLAKKVFNALVPPPAKPEDLGLRPWGYWQKRARARKIEAVHNLQRRGVPHV